MKEQLISLIITTLGEMDLDAEIKATPFSAETALFGRQGILDSIGLVTLIVAVEQGIEDQFGEAVSLADEKAFSQKSSPFLTVESLANYASDLIKAEQQ